MTDERPTADRRPTACGLTGATDPDLRRLRDRAYLLVVPLALVVARLVLRAARAARRRRGSTP